MRLVFFLLVLANLLFFVWSAGYLGGQEEGREPQRLQNQLQAERITVTPMLAPSVPSAPAAPSSAEPPAVAPPAADPAAPAPADPAPAAPAPAPAEPAPAAPASPLSKVAAQSGRACRRVVGVALKDGGVVQHSLQRAGFAVTVLPIEERNFWVNISGLSGKAAADKKAGDLKQLGVPNFHVMQGEGGSFAISFGVFGDEAAANQFLLALVKKGVKSARIDARTHPPALRLELRGTSELFAQRLAGLLAEVPGAAETECP